MSRDGDPSHDDPPWYIFRDLLKDNCNEWGARKRAGFAERAQRRATRCLLNPACNFRRSAPRSTIRTRSARTTTTRCSARAAGRAAVSARRRTYGPTHGNRHKARARALLPELPPAAAHADDEPRPLRPMLRRAELAWNHGQSQQDQKELKELYVDLEMFDSQLWIRAGYQTIVWGKTELFRNQDQFNPQDIGLASLAEPRGVAHLALGAARRLVVLRRRARSRTCAPRWPSNFDEYQSTDLGVCGEPYTAARRVRALDGLIAHGYLGVGLAGCRASAGRLEQLEGDRGRRSRRVALGPLQLRGHRLLRLPGHARGSRTSFTYSRNVDPSLRPPSPHRDRGKCRNGNERHCLDRRERPRRSTTRTSSSSRRSARTPLRWRRISTRPRASRTSSAARRSPRRAEPRSSSRST